MASEMTAAQETALQKIDDIAREHFDGFVAIFDAEDASGTGDDRSDCERLLFHGGFARCVGLCVIALEEIKRDERREREDLDDAD